MIRVLIVDDQALIRAAVAALLRAETDIEAIGEAADGAVALELARRLRPDVILMDIRMPGVDGIHATRMVCSDPALAATRVLILTTFEEDENLLASLRAGASGFIGKGAEPDEIARAIRAVHAGDSLLSPAATRSLINRYLDASPGSAPDRLDLAPIAALTGREREILELVGRGLSNDQIADTLTISPHTAKTHVNRIMTKLDAHDRAQLVIWAYETGIIARTA